MASEDSIGKRLATHAGALGRSAAGLARSVGAHPQFWIWLNVVAGLCLSLATVNTVADACFDAAAARDGIGYVMEWPTLRVADRACKAWIANPPWFIVSGLAAAPAVLLTWYWRDRKRRDDHRIAHESGIAQRFATASGLLASLPPMARIAGIYALWDVARESEAHRPTVRGTLAAFVRTTAPLPDPEAQEDPYDPRPIELAPDVQAAMHVLANHEWTREWKVTAPLDLRRTDLSGLVLEGGSLRGANLTEAHLHSALLAHVDLSGAVLTSARLRAANLHDSILRGIQANGVWLNQCNLNGADLRNAQMMQSDLEATSMHRANLSLANFATAKLVRAALLQANLDAAWFTGADLTAALLDPKTPTPLSHWRDAILPDGSRVHDEVATSGHDLPRAITVAEPRVEPPLGEGSTSDSHS